MPVDITYNEDGGIVLTASGKLTGEEIVKANETIYATEERIRSIKYQLCDFTGVEAAGDFDQDAVRALAEQDKIAARVNPDMVVALVAKKDSLFGFSRMWQTFTDESLAETQVFRTVVEAKAWLREKLTGRE
jgi:hypothetical protein